MKHVVDSFFAGLKDILRPRIVAVMLAPFFLSAVLWSFIVWLSWDWILDLGFRFYSSPIIQKFVSLLAPIFTLTEDPIAFVTVAAFIILVVFPAALITALFITSIFLVPTLVSEVRRTDYPHLTKKSNSIFTGTGTSIIYSIKYFVTWVVSLPLWVIIPGGALIIPFLLVAWFNSKLFGWEVMTEIADSGEIAGFISQNSRALFALGLLTSLIYYIPIVNFIAPVLTSAAFVRFCLKRYSKDH